MKHLTKILVLSLMFVLLVPALAQQGGEGNQGNGTVFIDNAFSTFSLGVPGGPICIAQMTTVVDVNNWIRLNPDGSTTIHWVGQEANITFYAEGNSGPEDVWIGTGATTLNYNIAEIEQFVWSVRGTVTSQITGETRDVRCQVVFRGGIKVFDLGFKGK